ncbi:MULTISPECIES: LacI family DNA-binding transcriptional regulator [Anoxynatronum]|uniref:Transcriptional regulator, LacI family n=2 Tax=Anoxynatronum TaxID=210622 RepID=A0AA45WSX8_9CLOT|nr:LacI family DNA-binding transcriptional regulator [Anoxynatronum buryatiense]SMP39900.1 transcriptional regulator, LacI family [Anoxynatronum buryatiense]
MSWAKKKVTIKMVADQANVSKTTISRYLNGKYEFMSEETRERIEKAIEALNYHPNQIARGLKSKKSGTIGMIVADITTPFSSILVKGVNDICLGEGYQLMIANSDEDPRKEEEYIRSMLTRQIEGLVINSTGYNDDLIQQLRNEGIFVTYAERRPLNGQIDTVTIDNEHIIKYVLDKLYGSGFEEVAFFSQTINKNATRQIRKEIFQRMTCERGGDAEALFFQIDQEAFSYDKAIMGYLQENPQRSKAVITGNGVAMLDFLRACRRQNIEIPDQVGLCGFDDWGWTELVGAGISAIAQPTYEIGARAAEILIGRIHSGIDYKDPIEIELKAQFVERGSTQIILK